MSKRQVENSQRKELDMVNWKTVRKIIVLLYRNGSMKKTHIAMSCRLRYDRCSLHIVWCESLKLVKSKTNDDGSETIGLTDRGIEIYSEEFAQEQIRLEHAIKLD